MSEAHPDLAALEALRTGESGADEATHLRACPECRADLEELGRLAGLLSDLQAERGIASTRT